MKYVASLSLGHSLINKTWLRVHLWYEIYPNLFEPIFEHHKRQFMKWISVTTVDFQRKFGALLTERSEWLIAWFFYRCLSILHWENSVNFWKNDCFVSRRVWKLKLSGGDFKHLIGSAKKCNMKRKIGKTWLC